MYITYTYNSEYSILTIFDTYILKTVEDVFYGTKGLNSIVLIDFRRSPWLHKKLPIFFFFEICQKRILTNTAFTVYNTFQYHAMKMFFNDFSNPGFTLNDSNQSYLLYTAYLHIHDHTLY